jgi:hypothetical protein
MGDYMINTLEVAAIMLWFLSISAFGLLGLYTAGLFSFSDHFQPRRILCGICFVLALLDAAAFVVAARAAL